jgi:hypothetical protein
MNPCKPSNLHEQVLIYSILIRKIAEFAKVTVVVPYLFSKGDYHDRWVLHRIVS